MLTKATAPKSTHLEPLDSANYRGDFSAASAWHDSTGRSPGEKWAHSDHHDENNFDTVEDQGRAANDAQVFQRDALPGEKEAIARQSASMRKLQSMQMSTRRKTRELKKEKREQADLARRRRRLQYSSVTLVLVYYILGVGLTFMNYGLGNKQAQDERLEEDARKNLLLKKASGISGPETLSKAGAADGRSTAASDKVEEEARQPKVSFSDDRDRTDHGEHNHRDHDGAHLSAGGNSNAAMLDSAAPGMSPKKKHPPWSLYWYVTSSFPTSLIPLSPLCLRCNDTTCHDNE